MTELCVRRGVESDLHALQQQLGVIICLYQESA